jgi:hypothetical protein
VKLEEPEWVFPFNGMKVGDSFFIPTLKTSNLIYIVDIVAKKAGIRVRAYAINRDGVLGVRVWRTR